jgi:hypothetical protein
MVLGVLQAENMASRFDEQASTALSIAKADQMTRY